MFGGLGQNVFNPALLGRAFLQAAFPAALTTWPAAATEWAQLRGDNFAFPFTTPGVDAVTEATPLGLMKFESTSTDPWSLMIGATGGSLGETAGLLILVCGGYLALRNYLNWRIPVSIFLTVALFSGLLFALDSSRFASPLFALFSGGLILGAMYMATDMVTSPVTNAGAWIFGIGIGLLVILIRTWGGLPEGVMYAILLMNALVPFINRVDPADAVREPRPRRQARSPRGRGMSDGADRRRRGRKLPIAPKSGRPGRAANGLNDDGETPPNGDGGRATAGRAGSYGRLAPGSRAGPYVRRSAPSRRSGAFGRRGGLWLLRRPRPPTGSVRPTPRPPHRGSR